MGEALISLAIGSHIYSTYMYMYVPHTLSICICVLDTDVRSLAVVLRVYTDMTQWGVRFMNISRIYYVPGNLKSSSLKLMTLSA